MLWSMTMRTLGGAAPVVRRAAGFEQHGGRGLRRDEAGKLCAGQTAARRDMPGRVRHRDLEHALGEINSNRTRHGNSFRGIDVAIRPFATTTHEESIPSLQRAALRVAAESLIR
jgi:hypothetical protein